MTAVKRRASPARRCRYGTDAATENRRRFEIAREALGWSLKQTAAEIEVGFRVLQGWLYEGHRDVPRLAVLLIEARAKALRPESTRHAKNRAILDGLTAKQSYSRIASDLGITKQAVQQIVRRDPALRAAAQRLLKAARAEQAALRARAVETVREHKTYAAGARATGLNPLTVAAACRAAGVFTRQPWARKS